MSKWKVPEGYVLEKIPGWHVKANGSRVRGDHEVIEGNMYPDGGKQVFEYDDAEPFAWTPFTDPQGKTHMGWNPNGRMVPLTKGWHPPVYVLRGVDEPAHVEAPIQELV